MTNTNWKRFLGAAIAMAAVAALAADIPHRSQMDAGTTVDVIDAGMSEVDAGVPELQGALRGELVRGKNVPQ